MRLTAKHGRAWVRDQLKQHALDAQEACWRAEWHHGDFRPLINRPARRDHRED